MEFRCGDCYWIITYETPQPPCPPDDGVWLVQERTITDDHIGMASEPDPASDPVTGRAYRWAQPYAADSTYRMLLHRHPRARAIYLYADPYNGQPRRAWMTAFDARGA